MTRKHNEEQKANEAETQEQSEQERLEAVKKATGMFAGMGRSTDDFMREKYEEVLEEERRWEERRCKRNCHPILERIHRCAGDPSRLTSEADVEWPPSETLLAYREVLNLFEGGECERAITQLRGLAGRPLELAPDSAVEDVYAHSLYSIGRSTPTRLLFHRIHGHICNYASDLEKKGEPDEALRVLTLVFDLSRQMASAEPVELAGVLMAQTMWKAAWKRIAAVYAGLGNVEGEGIARRCQAVANEFGELHLLPLAKREMKSFEKHFRWPFFWFHRRFREFMRTQLQETRQIARLWSEIVDNAECRAFLDRINGGV